MKIMIINPNSSEEMTACIQNCAEIYANGEFEVKTVCVPDAPEFIDYYSDQFECAPGMVKIVKDNEAEYDAFIVACHCDPNLDLLKQITNRLVIGIGEASMHLAAMLGHSFSVVSTGKHSIPNKLALIHKYHLDGACASVRGPKGHVDPTDSDAPWINAAQVAMEEDLAEVIVLGCAGFAGMSERLTAQLGVPVLDGIHCALMMAVGCVKAGYTTSKVRRYSDK